MVGLSARHRKWLSVEQLIEALGQVPSGSIVEPNRVGNLAVYDRADESRRFLGAIDMASGEYENYQDEEADQ